MENYDRQQYNGGDFREVGEDAFVGPSDGQEAVSEDAGQGDYWGVYPDRDIPQEEPQEQGFVEGDYDTGSDYDTGFIPEGEYTPGSEYDPGFVPQSGDDPGSGYEGGYDPEGGYGPEGDYGPEGSYHPEGGYEPLFTWGGFEDDVVAEEPVDAPTADSSGGTPPLETDGRTDATGDPEIQMYSDDVGQAGYDDGQEPNDASDPSGGTPPAQGGADSEDEQIEMPPEYVGQTGADDAGNDEIEMPPMYVGRTGLDAAHEEELAQYGTHEELAGLYRSLNENLYERYPDLVEGMNKQLESGEDLDTYEELKAATKGLPDQWYLRDAHHQRLEGRYGDEISVDPGLQTYDQLADYYKNLSMVLRDSDQEPDMTGLDTYEKLRVGTYELWEQRDQYLNQHEGEQHLEEKDESHTNDSHNNAPEIEMPPMYVGRDAGGQEPNDAPDPSGGTPRPETVGQVGADAGNSEIEFTPEEAADVPAQPDDAGDGEIEMNPEYVGRSDWQKVADKFDEKFPEDELMLQMKFRQMAEDNPDLRVALKNVFGWEDKSRSDWEKVADKFEEKFPEDELVQHIKFRQALEDNPTLKEMYKTIVGDDHPGEDGADRNYRFFFGTKDSDEDVETGTTPIDAGQAGADTGVDENDIEMLP